MGIGPESERHKKGEARFTRAPPSLSGVLRAGVPSGGDGGLCGLDRPATAAPEVGDLVDDGVLGGRRDAYVESA